MTMYANPQEESAPTVDQTSKPKGPKERFVLGQSSCYFETAQNLVGTIKAVDLDRLFINDNTIIDETEKGRSLKVLFNTGSEIRFIGFITAGDASITLDRDDIQRIRDEISKGTIVRAIENKDLVAMF